LEVTACLADIMQQAYAKGQTRQIIFGNGQSGQRKPLDAGLAALRNIRKMHSQRLSLIVFVGRMGDYH
jgi:hypothetical protein